MRSALRCFVHTLQSDPRSNPTLSTRLLNFQADAQCDCHALGTDWDFVPVLTEAHVAAKV